MVLIECSETDLIEIKYEYFNNGQIKAEHHVFNDNCYHRKDKPAYIKYHKNGKIKCEAYFLDDNHYRKNDKPTYIEYYENGQIKREEYVMGKGKYHGENDKPAFILYYENGQIKHEEYFLNDEQYREDNKPVKIEYTEDGFLEKHTFMDGRVEEVYLSMTKYANK